MSDLSITDKIASTWLGKKSAVVRNIIRHYLLQYHEQKIVHNIILKMINFHFAAGMSGMLMNSLR